MMKKILCVLLGGMLCLTAACSGNTQTNLDVENVPAYEEVPLTEEEEGILDAMGDDVNVISDDDYIQSVSELIYHTSDFVGTVYQMEGIFSADGENSSVYRTLVSSEQNQTLGLSLRYLEKEIPDGAWVCVTGIVAAGDNDGETVLDVVAIEALPEYGQAELPWDGSSVHQH